MRLFPALAAVPNTGAACAGRPGGSGDGHAKQSRSWRCHQCGPHPADVMSLVSTSGVTYAYV